MAQQEMIRTTLQAATLAIVALGALAGVGLFAIDAQVVPLKSKVATLERQQAAIVAMQADIATLKAAW